MIQEENQMKRKTIFSTLLALILSLTLMLPVMASSQEALAPQDAVEEGSGNPVEHRSPGDARITGKPTEWVVNRDDSDIDGPINQSTADATADIAVWAKIVDLGDADTIIYCIDIEWGNMKFVFGKDGGQWDPEERTYGAVDTGSWWEDNYPENVGPATEYYLDGLNNIVTVTNRSNAVIDASFDYRFDARFDGEPGGDGDNNLFNKEAGADNVVGNFFATNDLALDAAEELTDTSTINTATISSFTLVNADHDVNPPATPPNPEDLDEDDFPFNSVFFAFSGTPDDDSTLLSNAFTKVGIITVTITPAPPTP